MNWLATFPSTNARIFVTICLAIGYVVSAITSSWRGHPLSDGTLYGVGAFLTVWAGLDVTQFAVKRTTYAGPPATPDREDKPAIDQSKTPLASSVASRLAGGALLVRPLEEPEPGTPRPGGE